MSLKNINKFIFFNLMLFLSCAASADSNYHCSYNSEINGVTTEIHFKLSDYVYFGQLVPLSIVINGKNPGFKMNTVVVKDKPYIVLVDLQRIIRNDATISIFMINPEKNIIFVNQLRLDSDLKGFHSKGMCFNR